MPHLALAPELEAQLIAAARRRGCTPEKLIAFLLKAGEPGSSAAAEPHPLVAYTIGAEFRAKASDADRYVALLGWIAKHHAGEFADFIRHLDSGRKFVGLSAEEIRETCRHNHAREIPGTRFWAIMNLDTPSKRRFLRRLLVFVDAPDDVIAHVANTIGRRLGGVIAG